MAYSLRGWPACGGQAKGGFFSFLMPPLCGLDHLTVSVNGIGLNARTLVEPDAVAVGVTVIV